MSVQTTGILIVFSSQQNDTQEFNNRIQYYKEVIEQSRSLSSQIEYFLLYVTPHVPSFALQSPEIVRFAMKETEKGEQLLKIIGNALNIRVENQYISEGNADFQARSLAIELEVTTVLGYSKTYTKFLKFVETLQKYTRKYFKEELSVK